MNDTNKKYPPGSTVILACTCKSLFEDNRYGKGRRVHNVMAAKSGAPMARCAQCLTERTIGSA